MCSRPVVAWVSATLRITTGATAQEAPTVLPQGCFDHTAAADPSEPRLEHRLCTRQARQRSELQDAGSSGRVHPAGSSGRGSHQDGS